MYALSARISLFAVVVFLAIGLASTVAGAQSPPGTSPCPNVLAIPGHPVDPALHPTLTATWDASQRGVLVQWDTGSGAVCAWFQVKRGDAEYSGSGDNEWADFVIAPGPGARLRPAQAPGRECVRLYAVSFRGRSEPVEACAEVPAEGVPTPRPPGNPPPPSGTPWPAPAEARLAGHFVLLDENSFPLPPDRQVWFAGLSWAVLPGFTGTYEVQRAQVVGSGELQWQALPSGRLPVSLAVDGRISFAESVTPLTLWCFRVRTVTWSPAGIETGPFSEPACMPRPPSSGPGATPPTVPLPPVVGNSPAAAGETGTAIGALPLGILALVLVTAAGVRLRVTRVRRN